MFSKALPPAVAARGAPAPAAGAGVDVCLDADRSVAGGERDVERVRALGGDEIAHVGVDHQVVRPRLELDRERGVVAREARRLVERVEEVEVDVGAVGDAGNL